MIEPSRATHAGTKEIRPRIRGILYIAHRTLNGNFQSWTDTLRWYRAVWRAQPAISFWVGCSTFSSASRSFCRISICRASFPRETFIFWYNVHYFFQPLLWYRRQITFSEIRCFLYSRPWSFVYRISLWNSFISRFKIKIWYEKRWDL